jgi:hypothetical protein
VPLNSCLVELLRHKTVTSEKHSFVFTTSCGTRIDARNLTRAFYSALEKAEIMNFRFHDLRHTFATRLAQAGVDLYKVQRLLGHKSPTMTQRYAHHSPESLREGVLILERHHPTALAQIYHTEAKNQSQHCVTIGAGNGIWTRDPRLGKAMLYHWAIPAQLQSFRGLEFYWCSNEAVKRSDGPSRLILTIAAC